MLGERPLSSGGSERITTCASPERKVADELVARDGGVLTVVLLSRSGGDGGNGELTALAKNLDSFDIND